MGRPVLKGLAEQQAALQPLVPVHRRRRMHQSTLDDTCQQAAVSDIQFPQQMVHMSFHCAFTQVENLSYLPVAQPQ